MTRPLALLAFTFSHFLSVAVILVSLDTRADAVSFYPTGGNANQMVVADINHDNKPDVVTAGVGVLSVLLNRGDGTLLAHVDYPNSNGYFLAVADFNNDGNLDAVTVSQRDQDPIDTFLGNGDGTFQLARALLSNCGIDPGGLAAADFDGDRNVDLGIGHFAGGKLAILLGNGDGSFRLGSCTAEYVNEIVAVDLNNDLKVDLLGAYFKSAKGPDGIATLLGRGDASFEAPLQFDKPALLHSLKVVDVDGDGKLDLVAMGAHSVLTFFGRGNGTFHRPLTISSPETVFGFGIGTFDADARPDLLIETIRDSGFFRITFFAGKGDGTFSKGVSFAIPAYAGTLVGTDLDGDGKLNLVGTLPSMFQPSQVFVFHGNGDGTFQ